MPATISPASASRDSASPAELHHAGRFPVATPSEAGRIPSPLPSFVEFEGPSSGPRTKPIPFTGLLDMPRRIEWRNAPLSPAYTLDLSAGDVQVRLRSQTASFDISAQFQLPAGKPVSWRIACTPGGEGSVEGIFWTLGEAERTRIAAARELLEHGDDEEMKWIAVGLSCAECGLFDEAIRVLEGVATLAGTAGRRALASRALVAVFDDMEEKLPPMANCHFRRWIRSRRQNQANTLQYLMGHSPESGANRARTLGRESKPCHTSNSVRAFPAPSAAAAPALPMRRSTS